jgi:uncharacterized membrane protein
MPSYLTDWPVWRDFIPMPLFAALIAGILGVVISRNQELFWRSFFVILALALFGITTGNLIGQSQEPVVGAVVPAMLGLMGGLIAYLLAAKTEDQQLLVALAVAAFSINLLVGGFWGSRLRYDFQDHQNSENYRIALEAIEQNVRLQKLVYEKQLRDAREALGLSASSEVSK